MWARHALRRVIIHIRFITVVVVIVIIINIIIIMMMMMMMMMIIVIIIIIIIIYYYSQTTPQGESQEVGSQICSKGKTPVMDGIGL